MKNAKKKLNSRGKEFDRTGGEAWSAAWSNKFISITSIRICWNLIYQFLHLAQWLRSTFVGHLPRIVNHFARNKKKKFADILVEAVNMQIKCVLCSRLVSRQRRPLYWPEEHEIDAEERNYGFVSIKCSLSLETGWSVKCTRFSLNIQMQIKRSASTFRHSVPF